MWSILNCRWFLLVLLGHGVISCGADQLSYSEFKNTVLHAHRRVRHHFSQPSVLRSGGSSAPCIRIAAAASVISASVAAILEAMVNTSMAIMAASANNDIDEAEGLEQELGELEEQLEEEISISDDDSSEEDVAADDESSEESDEDVDEEVEAKTIDDILEDAVPGRKTKGKTEQFEKEGGDEQAGEDFNSLRPTDVYDIGYGTVGTLSDGSKVILRTESGDGRTTLEIQKANSSRVIKIRYND